MLLTGVAIHCYNRLPVKVPQTSELLNCVPAAPATHFLIHVLNLNTGLAHLLALSPPFPSALLLAGHLRAALRVRYKNHTRAIIMLVE